MHVKTTYWFHRLAYLGLILLKNKYNLWLRARWCKILGICLFLHNIHGAEHDALDKAVHCETFHNSVLEKCVFHLVRHGKRCRIKEQTEIVGAVWIAWHVQKPQWNMFSWRYTVIRSVIKRDLWLIEKKAYILIKYGHDQPSRLFMPIYVDYDLFYNY